jgi:hypothetical protein
MVRFLASYNEHYARLNPLWPATVAAPAGTVLIDREVAGRDAFNRGDIATISHAGSAFMPAWR